jgi:hypothetical protein
MNPIRNPKNLSQQSLKELAKLLDSARAPLRKSSIEALALVSRVSPKATAFLLPRLHALLADEPQSVLANNALEILINYANTSKRAAQRVAPIFRETLTELGPKMAAKVKRALKEMEAN